MPTWATCWRAMARSSSAAAASCPARRSRYSGDIGGRTEGGIQRRSWTLSLKAALPGPQPPAGCAD
jgi:hypothetical protein